MSVEGFGDCSLYIYIYPLNTSAPCMLPVRLPICPLPQGDSLSIGRSRVMFKPMQGGKLREPGFGRKQIEMSAAERRGALRWAELLEIWGQKPFDVAKEQNLTQKTTAEWGTRPVPAAICMRLCTTTLRESCVAQPPGALALLAHTSRNACFGLREACGGLAYAAYAALTLSARCSRLPTPRGSEGDKGILFLDPWLISKADPLPKAKRTPEVFPCTRNRG